MSYPPYHSISDTFKNCGLYSDSDSDVGSSSLVGSDDEYDFDHHEVDLLSVIDYNNLIESIPIFRVFIDPYSQDEEYVQLTRIYEQKLLSYCKALALTTGNNIDKSYVHYCVTIMTYNVIHKIIHPRSEPIPFCYPVHILTKITGCHEHVVRVVLDLLDKMIKTCHNYDTEIIDSMILESEMVNLDILTSDEKSVLINNLSYCDSNNNTKIGCRPIHLRILLAVLISFYHDFHNRNPSRDEIYAYVNKSENLDDLRNMYRTPWLDFCLSYSTQI